jgi:outer membrane protein TolC
MFFAQENVDIERAKSQAEIDRRTADLQLKQAQLDKEDARLEYFRSRDRLKDLRAKDIPLAESMAESTFSAYKAGKLGYAELIASRKTLLDLKNQDIQLRSAIISAHLRCLIGTGPLQ